MTSPATRPCSATCRACKAHVAGLSAKAYWDQFKSARSPDFVAMFIPGDSFLVAALERAPDLMVEAMDRRVIIVTPTTLFAPLQGGVVRLAGRGAGQERRPHRRRWAASSTSASR